MISSLYENVDYDFIYFPATVLFITQLRHTKVPRSHYNRLNQMLDTQSGEKVVWDTYCLVFPAKQYCNCLELEKEWIATIRHPLCKHDTRDRKDDAVGTGLYLL